jgi:cell wall-associated NlpC family hydrolase
MLLQLVGCGSEPVRSRSGGGEAGDQVAAIAQRLVGAPYRYGGESPRGFDCSGLVYYAYQQLGISIPRTAQEQFRRSQPVDARALRPGDLVFFDLPRQKTFHVGIYAGRDRFVHAPTAGKRVTYASLSDPFWHARLVGAGRLP